MKRISLLRMLAVCFLALPGCAEKKPVYGTERQLFWPSPQRQVWAVAPAINLSGQKQVDPLLQADLLYQQLQEVNGITAVPVNRVVEVYASLRIEKVESPQQAALVCSLLGCDGLVVPTVTAYDPYEPPKFGVSLQLLLGKGSLARPASVDIRELARQATPPKDEPLSPPRQGDFVQAVGMFDAANGTVRRDLMAFAAGRNDPAGAWGAREYLVNMDRYCGFVYHSLLRDLISSATR
ncbi:MAG TPA: hypothetical protein VHD56_15425 [Tepidisphaeraceae bacterium]|nr:hypothetical protein [Tepidisphaeraceae bacterium]